jgi:hypothetical protein
MSALANDMRRALDPTYLMREIGMQPDPWQEAVLRSDARNMALLCSRQSGKSTTCAVLACHQALYDPGLILITAPAQRQAQELFIKVRDTYRELSNVPRVVSESAMRMHLANGSRVIAIPGTADTVRGFSGVKTVIVDEAAWVSDNLITALRPMLATTNGRFIALTTPYGKRGFFWEAWEHGGPRWWRMTVTADDCPRISREWLDDARETMGEWKFQQEFYCEWIDNDEQLFPSELIEAALSSEVQPLWN